MRGDSTFAAVTSTTINNNANNRVITGSGTADTLEGESTLTYDGDYLTLTTNADQEGILLQGGDNYNTITLDANRGVANYSLGDVRGKWNGAEVNRIRFNTGADTTNKDEGQLTIWTKPSGGSIAERFRIDSSGRVMIGTDTEGDSTADNLTIADSGACGITIRSGSTSEGNIFFSDGTSGAAEYAGTIQYNHNSNYMQFATDGSERMRIVSDGRVSIGGMAPDTGVNLHIESSGEANMLLEGSASGVGGYLM